MTKTVIFLYSTDCAVITTITGISDVLGAAIVGEIGDISRFESAPKLVAYAGLDASVKQSGDFSGTKKKFPNAALRIYGGRFGSPLSLLQGMIPFYPCTIPISLPAANLPNLL